MNDSELLARIDERTERILKDNENFRKDIRELSGKADILKSDKCDKEDLKEHSKSNAHLNIYTIIGIITIISSISAATIFISAKSDTKPQAKIMRVR